MMGAVELKDPLSSELRAEIARLHSRGFSLLPLDGKRPLVKRWTDHRLTLGQVLGPMSRVPSFTYAVRLGGYAVADLDEDHPSLVKEVEGRFGPSLVHVKSPRGRHLYYAADKPIRINLRAEGLPVDFKSGPSSYVVGPHSIRPDSGEYHPIKGMLGDALSFITVSVDRPATAPQVQQGDRHRELVTEAIRMVEYVDDPSELSDNLRFFRDNQFQRPDEVSNSEVQGVAEWAWQKRLDNSVFAGRNSSFRVSRAALDALKGLPNSSDCIALYTVLTDLHGHNPNKPFSLVWKSMKASGQTDLSRRRFIDARNAIQAIGLLQLVSNHRAGTRHQTFRLSSRPKRKGGGLYLTYVDQSGNGNLPKDCQARYSFV